MTAPIAEHQDNQLITRRSIFLGAAASLICAPAIVQVARLMPVRRIILASDLHHHGFCDRLWASPYYYSAILKRQDAGLSVNEIAVETNERRWRNRRPNQPWPTETVDWDVRHVLQVIQRNEFIRRSDAINRAYRSGALVYASNFPAIPSIAQYQANEKDRSNG